MGRLSTFVVPVAAGLSLYVVLLMFLRIDQLLALVVAILTAWAVKALLKRTQPQTSRNR